MRLQECDTSDQTIFIFFLHNRCFEGIHDLTQITMPHFYLHVLDDLSPALPLLREVEASP